MHRENVAAVARLSYSFSSVAATNVLCFIMFLFHFLAVSQEDYFKKVRGVLLAHPVYAWTAVQRRHTNK